MQNESEELQRAAVNALRNIVYENNENKMEIKDCEGLPVILRLLKKNRDIETRQQLTGKGAIPSTLDLRHILYISLCSQTRLHFSWSYYCLQLWKHPDLESVTSTLPLILPMLFSLQGCCGICLLMTFWKSSSLEKRSNLSQTVCWCPAQACLKGKTLSWSSSLTLKFSTMLLAAWGITNWNTRYKRLKMINFDKPGCSK